MKVYVICEIDSYPYRAFSTWELAWDYWWKENKNRLENGWTDEERLRGDIFALEVDAK